jgi:hypothetical protein
MAMSEMRELLDTKAKKRGYQGHESWNAWNVSLWLNNDYGTYQEMMRLIRAHRNDRAGNPRPKKTVASLVAKKLREQLDTKTPDGAKYSQRSVMLAVLGNIE